MPYYPEFADLLNRHLQAHDHSAAWLARRLRVNPSTVSRWLDGSTRPDSPETVNRIAEHLQVRTITDRHRFLAAAGFALIASNDSENSATPINSANKATTTSSSQPSLPAWIARSIDAAPDWLVNPLLNRSSIYTATLWRDERPLEELKCDERGLDLAQQRLTISSAFGAYFSGLLEREGTYIELDGQVDTPQVNGLEHLDAVQRMVWACIHPRGPRALIIGADGGMGKSTLASKLIRCLLHQQRFDLLLGDSAKTKRVEAVTGAIVHMQPGYYDPGSCLARIRQQLGLPTAKSPLDLDDIRDRLAGRRALIVIDNLETVRQGDHLMRLLNRLLSTDLRAIITARQIDALPSLTLHSMVVHLRPIVELTTLSRFLQWHIQHFQDEHPALRTADISQLTDTVYHQLIERTGGVPLLVQLVFSEAARSSWAYLDGLPSLYGDELLQFLYDDRWHDLVSHGSTGDLSRHLLKLVVEAQTAGKRVNLARLRAWAAELDATNLLQSALRLLYERFLLVNHDRLSGDFSTFPSLAEFVDKQSLKL